MNYENELFETYKVYAKELRRVELPANKRTIEKLAKIVCDYLSYKDKILGKDLLTKSEKRQIIQKIV